MIAPLARPIPILINLVLTGTGFFCSFTLLVNQISPAFSGETSVTKNSASADRDQKTDLTNRTTHRKRSQEHMSTIEKSSETTPDYFAKRLGHDGDLPLNDVPGEDDLDDEVSTEQVKQTKPGQGPVLKSHNSKMRIALTDFRTRTMPMNYGACKSIKNSFSEDFEIPPEQVTLLGDTGDFSQTRICTANGSLIITCSGGTATFSPRKKSAADGCG